MARFLLALVLLLAWTFLSPQGVQASPRKPYLIEVDDPDNVMEVISQLGRRLARAGEFDHSKRGVDFGLGRGFSGAQAAKHLMGLAAANYAVGPGRKKRSQFESVSSDPYQDASVNASS